MNEKMRWFKFFPGDWALDTQGMTAVAKGLYIDMLCMQWSGRRLPVDFEELQMIMPALTERVYRELLQHFSVDGEWLVNNRLERERADANTRSENGRRGAARKWSEKAQEPPALPEPKPEPSPDIAPPFEPPHAPALGDEMLHHMQGHMPDHMADHMPKQCYTEPEAEPELESNSNTNMVVGNRRTRARRARPADPLMWSWDDGFTGITDGDMERWKVTYPDVNIEADILAAAEHVRSHPEKQIIKRWRRFLTSWFARTQRYAAENRRRAEAGGVTAAPARRGPSRAHIPEDAHPDDEHMWFMTNGWTPRLIPIYRTRDGRERWRNGDYIDEETSQEHTDENDE